MRTDDQVELKKQNQMQTVDAISEDTKASAAATVNLGASIRKQVEQGASFSGGESNHFWINLDGKDYTDLSGISGLSHGGDSRSFALFDYDHDGFQDMVIVNANAPCVKLMHNRIGEQQKNGPAQFVAINFVGGVKSNRDAYGAKVLIEGGGHTLLREHRCGEGLAAQNSATMMIGLGDFAAELETVTVTFPSGKIWKMDVQSNLAGKLLTASEESGISVGEYAAAKSLHAEVQTEHNHAHPSAEAIDFAGETGKSADHRLYVLSYPTCSACKKAIPRLGRLKAEFGEELALYAVPYGSAPGTTEEWIRYSERFKPAYEPLNGITAEQVAAIEHGLDSMGLEMPMPGCGAGVDCQCATPCGTESLGYGAPTTLVTDGAGNLLSAFAGVPSVSQLKKLFH